MLRSVMAIVCGLGLLVLAVPASSADQQFFLEAEFWVDGEQLGKPNLLVEPNTEATVAVGSSEAVWQLRMKVEPVKDAHAPANTLWMHLGLDQRTAEGWEELTDTLLGVPEGEWATLSVVEGDAESTPETAAVFLRVRARRVDTPQT